jgi:hypothetical protein
MQNKTTLRFHLTSIKITFIKNTMNNKWWQGCGEKGTLIHCWWECKKCGIYTQWNFIQPQKRMKFCPSQVNEWNWRT